MENKPLEPFVLEAVKKHHNLAVDLCDDLYANPEISGEEYRTSEKIVDILREAGYEVEYPYMGYPTGFRGVLDNGEGPSVAILTEYDALPGIGHGCGHNVHGSMSVLAALAMADIKDKFKGKVYVFGTPAEEADGSKIGMAARGAFDDMALAVMIHSNSGNLNIPDMDLLSLSCYIVDFYGATAHAVAGPWKGHNALTAARKFLDLIDARRECFTPDIFVNGIITEGGLTPNVLPDKASVRLEFRTDSSAKLEQVDEIIHKCANGAAMALDCTVNFTKGFDNFADMVRVPVLEAESESLLKALGRNVTPVVPASGSSDVGNVSYHCPAIQTLLAICEEPHALHTIAFRDETVRPMAHQAIADGASLITSLVYRVLTDEEKRKAIYQSYLESKERKLSV